MNQLKVPSLVHSFSSSIKQKDGNVLNYLFKFPTNTLCVILIMYKFCAQNQANKCHELVTFAAPWLWDLFSSWIWRCLYSSVSWVFSFVTYPMSHSFPWPHKSPNLDICSPRYMVFTRYKCQVRIKFENYPNLTIKLYEVNKCKTHSLLLIFSP